MGNHILCAIDASPASASAASVAAQLSRQLGGEAMLMHVESEPPEAGGLASIAHARERGRLRALVDANDFPATPRVRVESGDPARTLVWAAREHDAQLIVLGTQGGTGPGLSVGKVAAEVVRRAPTPVVLVPPIAGTSLADEPQRSVVCVIQESNRETDVLKLGDDLVARLGGRLYAVHALRAGLVHPATALLSLAEEMCADLIVLAFDARSLAAPIAANARCPVVALPPNAELGAGSGHYELTTRAA